MSDQLSLLDDQPAAKTKKTGTPGPEKATASKPEKPAVEKPKAAKAAVSKEPEVLSVSQLNQSIKSTLEGNFSLIWIKGEISNFTAHGSGHFYFSLKDSKAQVSAVMFRGANSRINFKPKVGDEVLVRARVSVYVPRGNYQIVVEVMEPVGAGALQREFDELKKKLQAEGLFEASKKRPIPALPKKIAVVTSPTGAAFKDILNVLGRRYPGADVLLVPAVVQGKQAAGSLCRAMDALARLADIDVVIVGRGGGSMEDLWCFNDETLARKIAGFPIPVISAVGHEIDFTISDFVADLRAATPSAAAEIVAKSASEITQRIINLKKRLYVSQTGQLRERVLKTKHLRAKLIHPSRYLQEHSQRRDELSDRLKRAVEKGLLEKRNWVKQLQLRMGSPESLIGKKKDLLVRRQEQLTNRLEKLLSDRRFRLRQSAAMLDGLSPLKVLDRGYTLVTDSDGRVLDSAEVKPEQVVKIRFSDRQAQAKIESIEEKKEN